MSLRSSATSACLVILLTAFPTLASERDTDGNWPSFRGPAASGIAPESKTPVQWDVESKKNVLWKTAIPGLGHSSPVVWGDRVFVTTAISGKDDPELRVGLYGNVDPVEDDTVHQFKVLCIDKRTGKVLWERTAFEGVPKIKRHTKASHANSTPATDGKHVVVFFGSEGLYCYDVDGKLLWKKDLGILDAGWFRAPEAQWGYGSSPVIHGDRVVIVCDVQKDSFIAALRLKDGETLWKTSRDEVPGWGTPTVLETGGRTQVVVNGWKHIGGYDLANGTELWKMTGGGDIPIPTPIVAHDLVFITNAHGDGAPIYAIRTNAKGDISLAEGASSNEFIVWSRARSGAYMQTPLAYGDYLYLCRDSGVLTVYAARTGEKLSQARLGDGSTGFTASPVAADGKVYFTSEMGDIVVVKAGVAKAEVLATNEMGEICMATPAISDDILLFRTQGHLVAIAEAESKHRQN